MRDFASLVTSPASSAATGCYAPPTSSTVTAKSLAFTTCGSVYGASAALTFGDGSYRLGGGSAENLNAELVVYQVNNDGSFGYVAWDYVRGAGGNLDMCFAAVAKTLGGQTSTTCKSRDNSPTSPAFRIERSVVDNTAWELFRNGNGQGTYNDLNFSTTNLVTAGVVQNNGAPGDTTPEIALDNLQVQPALDPSNSNPWGTYSHCSKTAGDSFVPVNFPTRARVQIGTSSSYSCDGVAPSAPRSSW